MRNSWCPEFVGEEPDHPGTNGNPADVLTLPFDQYGRYKLIQQAIDALRAGNTPLTVLDVGGWPGTLARFLPHDRVVVVDLNNVGGVSVRADGCQLPFADGPFDAVVSSDTFEHVPDRARHAFLSEMMRVSRGIVLLGAPFHDPMVVQAEQVLQQLILARYGEHYDFIEEHLANGLPDLDRTLAWLREGEFDPVVLPGGYLYRWLFGISLFFLLQWRFHDQELSARINAFYNRSFYDQDNQEPSYRKLVVATGVGAARPSRLAAELSRPAANDLAADLMTVQTLHLMIQTLGERWSERAGTAEKEISRLIQESERVTQDFLAQIEDKTQLIQALKGQVLERQASVERMSAELSETQASVERMSAELSETQAVAEALSEQRVQQERSIASLSDQVENQTQFIQGLKGQVLEHRNTMRRLSAELSAKTAAEETLSAQLLAITHSRGWALLQLLWRVRRGLIPSGSSRARALRQTFLAWRVLNQDGLSAFWHRTVAWLRRSRTANIATVDQSTPLPLAAKGQDQLGIPTAYDVICFPIIDWEHRFQRPQQLASLFARHGHRVFYLRLTFHDHGPSVEWKQVAERIFQVQLPGPPDLNRFLESLPATAQQGCLQALQELFEAANIRDAICMVQLPFWTPLALELHNRYGWKVVFDCMDEHNGLTILRPEMLEDETKLASNADLVLVSSQKLWDKHNGHAARCLRLPNGAEFDHFHQPANGQELADLRHPIVGYYGAIMEWFDAETVRVAARARPQWSFVLIGNVDTPAIEPLRHLPNVHFLGEQPYSRLPGYLHKFDVCLIPFKLGPIIQATNPVKFYEYLSAGKPVVSVPMPELMPYQELFYAASGGDEFVAQIERALAEDSPARAAARTEWARHQTWQARYDTLAPAINSLHGLVSIVIVSYNSLDRIRECLESIFDKTHYPRYEVIVADNGSTPDVVDYLGTVAASHPQVRLVLNHENLGFARANNLGLQAVGEDAQYVVLLNNDVVVSRGWLTTLVRWLQDSSVGLVGSVTNPSGAFNEAAVPADYQNLSDMDGFAARYAAQHRGRAFDIPMLAMYCVALRRAVYQEIGPLDEQFGVGMFEDDDFSLRVRKAGYRVICAEDVFIHHAGRSSFGRLSEAEYQKVFDENRRRFETKWNIQWQRPTGR
jgi:GT2 family glycosyltransferase/uncharacterized coiled-coil protein SlyX